MVGKKKKSLFMWGWDIQFIPRDRSLRLIFLSNPYTPDRFLYFSTYINLPACLVLGPSLHHFHFIYVYCECIGENVLWHRTAYVFAARTGDKKLTYHMLAADVWKLQSNKEGQVRESIQSKSPPDPGHHIGKWLKLKKRYCTREPKVSLFPAGDHKDARKQKDSITKTNMQHK